MYVDGNELYEASYSYLETKFPLHGKHSASSLQIPRQRINPYKIITRYLKYKI
jgi:hypothetical protein